MVDTVCRIFNRWDCLESKNRNFTGKVNDLGAVVVTASNDPIIFIFSGIAPTPAQTSSGEIEGFEVALHTD